MSIFCYSFLCLLSFASIAYAQDWRQGDNVACIGHIPSDATRVTTLSWLKSDVDARVVTIEYIEDECKQLCEDYNALAYENAYFRCREIWITDDGSIEGANRRTDDPMYYAGPPYYRCYLNNDVGCYGSEEKCCTRDLVVSRWTNRAA